MSAANKHRKPPGSASGPGTASSATTAARPPGVIATGVWGQLLVLVGLSCALGFTFNAASPLGIRFGAASTAPVVPVSVKVAEAPPVTSSAAPALQPKPVVPPPLPPLPAKAAVASVPPKTVPASLPNPTLPATPWSVPVKPANSNSIAAAVPPPTVQTNPAPIHWPEAKTLAAERRAVLVDVRHKAMYDAGHIPGATSLPEMSPPEEFKTFLSQQATNVVLIVYCSSTSCSQSARVANRLVNEFRWPAVRYMTGGYQEYQQIEGARLHAPPAP